MTTKQEVGYSKYSKKIILKMNNMTSIIIPDSVTEIDDEAFFGTGLTSVTVPDSVTKIGEMAFWDCHDSRFDDR